MSTASKVTELNSMPAQRFMSFDALRGFDMFWIIGGDVAIQSWLKYSHLSSAYAAADTSTWQMALYRQLEHCPWEGFRFYDLIFPLFLFVIGLVIPFSIFRMQNAGIRHSAIVFRILRRTLLLFILGLLYNDLLQFNFQDFRYAGVLQRLAIGYGFAALVALYLKPRAIAGLSGILLVGYYLILLMIPVPAGQAGDITREGNLAGYVDRLVLQDWFGGKIYEEYYGFGDNEGLLSTIPSLVTALLGVLAGCWLKTGYSQGRKFLGMLVAGLILLAAGYVWSGGFSDIRNLHDRYGVFPVIKNLWTSSYVLWAGGWSLLLLALFYGLIDGLGFKAWAWVFVPIGANAITIYLISHFIDLQPLSKQLFGGMARIIADGVHSVSDVAVVAMNKELNLAIILSGIVILEWLLLWFLYSRKIFLRV